MTAAALLMTLPEIDALALPPKTTAGSRPADLLPLDSPFALTHRAGPEAARDDWYRRDVLLGQRMAAALAARYGWTESQTEAAAAVYLLVPSVAYRKNRSYPVEVMMVLCEAARRAGAVRS